VYLLDNSQRVQQNLTILKQFLKLMPIVEFDRSAAEEFGKIQAELRRIGRPTGEIDAIIAAIARSRCNKGDAIANLIQVPE